MRILRKAAVWLAAACAVAFWAGAAAADTEIFLGSGPGVAVSARNVDFTSGRGLLRFSPAGLSRRAQYAPQGATPLAWKSRYASLAFLTYFDVTGPARGSAFLSAGVDGINTAGLKVGALSLAGEFAPVRARGRSIDAGDFLQYLLDNFRSVDEVVNAVEGRHYAVTPLPTPGRTVRLHYFVTDAGGNSAVVEFLDGGVAHIVVQPDVPVLTDAPYAECLAGVNADGTLGGPAVSGGPGPQDRFLRAAYSVKHPPAPKTAEAAEDEGFAILASVPVPPGLPQGRTQWSIVTDVAARRVYFRSFGGRRLAVVDLRKLAAQAKVTSDVDLLRTDLAGDIGALFDASAAFNPAGAPPAPDYAEPAGWAELPAGKGRKAVDVFFVHPTTYFFPNSWNESLAFGRRNGKVAASLQGQAGVFAASCNVYAPHYRDANIKALRADPASREKALALAYADVERAFDNYLRRSRRPFILAGHSQGSELLLRLLKRRFGNAKLRRRLVAAYLIGWSVTAADVEKYPFLKVSRRPGEVGAVVTYNTQTAHPGFSIVRPGAIGVNPLSMGTGTEAEGKERNLGAVFFTDKGRVEVPHFTGARNVGGALVVPELDSPCVTTPIPGFYHPYDYAIFYKNLERDAAGRIRAYFRAGRGAPRR